MEARLMGNSTKKKKILYIYPQTSTFVRKDILFLSRRYKVAVPHHQWTKKAFIGLNFVQQFFFLLRNINGCKAIFVMFGGYWSFLPALMGRLFRRPVFIIPGGTDCVSFPEINYGSLRKPLLKAFIKKSFQLCTQLLPVSKTLVETDYSYLPEISYPKQGYAYFFPNLKTPFRVIHNGYDPEIWKVHSAKKNAGSFITVASVSDQKRWELKGIDLIIKIAPEFKECNFTVVGVQEDFKKHIENIPDNIRMISFVAADDLKQFLQENQFYLQLSISEGFPNALCEAMLSGCIPMGSNVGAIPEIIGDAGFIVSKRAVELLREKMNLVLSLSEEEKMRLSLAARERIIMEYPIQKREAAFFEVIEKGEWFSQ